MARHPIRWLHRLILGDDPPRTGSVLDGSDVGGMPGMDWSELWAMSGAQPRSGRPGLADAEIQFRLIRSVEELTQSQRVGGQRMERLTIGMFWMSAAVFLLTIVAVVIAVAG